MNRQLTICIYLCILYAGADLADCSELSFLIHTRDQGQPDSYEAMAKVRLDKLTVLEVKQFSERDIGLILKIVSQYQSDWLEVWNEIFEGR